MKFRRKAHVLVAALMWILAAAPYYLGICGQRVALYEAETNRYYLSDTMIYFLPKADQELLRHGIPLENAEAAAAALEDFCS